MKLHHHPFLLSLPFALASGALQAQCPESRGMFAGAPVVVSVDDAGIPGLDPSIAYYKEPGFKSVAPRTATRTNQFGRFDFAAIFKSCGATKPIDVDALSIGEDWILADDTTGRVAIPANRWASITLSVSRKAQGAPGSRIATEAATTDGAGADLFSYILPGSALPSEVVGNLERSQDSREIDLGTGSTQRDIDALDLFIPMYAMDPGVVAMMPQQPSIFFSVSKASLANVPASWWGNIPPSGTIIFQITWVPKTNTWSCPPRVYKTWRELGLNVDEDVDALGLDLADQRMLFSTKTRGRNQLLFLSLSTDLAAPVPYSDQSGKPITDRIELLQGDEVDAICAMDPSIRARRQGPNAAFWVYGTPASTIFPPPPALSGSGFRAYNGTNVEWRSYGLGWTPSGPGAGAIAAFITFPGSLNPILPLASFPRVPASPFCGDPHEVVLKIPAWAVLSNIQLAVRWFALNGPKTELVEGHPLLIRM